MSYSQSVSVAQRRDDFRERKRNRRFSLPSCLEMGLRCGLTRVVVVVKAGERTGKEVVRKTKNPTNEVEVEVYFPFRQERWGV